jgi:hypothetical protein
LGIEFKKTRKARHYAIHFVAFDTKIDGSVVTFVAAAFDEVGPQFKAEPRPFYGGGGSQKAIQNELHWASIPYDGTRKARHESEKPRISVKRWGEIEATPGIIERRTEENLAARSPKSPRKEVSAGDMELIGILSDS